MTDVIDGLNMGAVRLGGTDIQMSPLPIPVTYFENAPNFGHLNGIIQVTLTVSGVVPDGDKARQVFSIATILRCNIPAAIALRDAINGALLLAQPVDQSETGKAN